MFLVDGAFECFGIEFIGCFGSGGCLEFNFVMGIIALMERTK